MTAFQKSALAALGLFVITAFVYVVLTGWEMARHAALVSCVQSVGSDLVEFSRFDMKGRHDGQWHILSELEANQALNDAKFDDCPTNGGSPADMREKKYKVAVKSTGEFFYEVRVWSTGFDNISGTDDDLVFPYGETAIAANNLEQ